jgi:hypothetical protein
MGFLVWQPSAEARQGARWAEVGAGGITGTRPGQPLIMGSSTATNWRISVRNVA